MIYGDLREALSSTMSYTASCCITDYIQHYTLHTDLEQETSAVNTLQLPPPMKDNSLQNTSFFASRAVWITALLLILGLGFAIRLYDLTDLPLDFHPTRQLLSALKARGMYYQTLSTGDVSAEQRSFAIQQWKVRASVEPVFFERIVAFTYRFTGEQVWVARRPVMS